MDAEHITNLGQAIFLSGIGVATLIYALSKALGNLFSSMGSGYGGVIATLTLQNADQQKQITTDHIELDKLRTSLAAAHEENENCKREQANLRGEIRTLREQQEKTDAIVAALRKELSDKGQISDVVVGMADVSVKVDQAIKAIEGGKK